MKVLFIVGHPAHVHFFRNVIKELRSRGHRIRVGIVAKETTTQLLALYDLDYTVLGRNIPNPLAKILTLPGKDLRFYRHLCAERPDLVVSVSSPYAAHACAALSIPHVAFTDTEIASFILSVTYPFTDVFLTPSSFVGNLGAKHIRYNGYKELAYLHPNWFTPSKDVLDLVHAISGEKLILVRVASWDSSHDLDSWHLGIRLHDRWSAILHELERYGRVLVTSERPLPSDLQKYIVHIPLNRIHDLIAHSSLYIGEGATMAAEAGILGIPWIFLSPSGRGYLEEQQHRYGLGFWEKSDEAALARAKEILTNRNAKTEWMSKRQNLLAEKIDVTRYITRFIEHWPRSYEEETAKNRMPSTAMMPRAAEGRHALRTK